MRALIYLLWLALLGLGVACGAPTQAKGSPLCDALAARVPGIAVIKWDNGITSSGATWGTMLDTGIIHGDEPSLVAAAVSINDNPGAFQPVLDAAPEILRPHLERLHTLLRDPAAVLARRNDADVQDDIRAVRDATPPTLCGRMH